MLAPAPLAHRSGRCAPARRARCRCRPTSSWNGAWVGGLSVRSSSDAGTPPQGVHHGARNSLWLYSAMPQRVARGWRQGQAQGAEVRPRAGAPNQSALASQATRRCPSGKPRVLQHGAGRRRAAPANPGRQPGCAGAPLQLIAGPVPTWSGSTSRRRWRAHMAARGGKVKVLAWRWRGCKNPPGRCQAGGDHQQGAMAKASTAGKLKTFATGGSAPWRGRCGTAPACRRRPAALRR